MTVLLRLGVAVPQVLDVLSARVLPGRRPCSGLSGAPGLGVGHFT